MKISLADIGGSALTDVNLKVPNSCYQANYKGKACGECDACVLRQNGFAQAGVADPTNYQ